MPYPHVDSQVERVGKWSGQAVIVGEKEKPVLITAAGVPHGCRVVRKVAVTGVRVTVTGDDRSDAEDKAKQMAARWFANAAIVKGGNAVVDFRRTSCQLSARYNRERGGTDYDCNCTFTGKVVEVLIHLKKPSR